MLSKKRDSESEKQIRKGKNSFTTRNSKKRRASSKPIEGKEPGFQPSMQYRDRAKERRERGCIEDDSHIVKGLDFKLLSQVKQQELRPDKVDLSRTEPMVKPLLFHSALTRSIYDFLHQTDKKATQVTSREHITDNFLPGRTMYAFDLVSEDMDHIPMTIHASKEDCPDPNDYITGAFSKLDQFVLGKAKRMAVEHTTGPIKAGAHDEEVEEEDENEDEDIFPDAGRSPVRYEDEKDRKQSLDSGGYFTALSAELTEQEEEEKKALEYEKMEREKNKLTQQKLQAEMEKKKRIREKLLSSMNDDDEQYGAAYMDESDEEERDSNRKKNVDHKLDADLKEINKIMDDKNFAKNKKRF